jgi:hypothetical protein
MRITRRHLQLGLAALWLLDAALQSQPFMFTRGFVHSVLAPAGQGLPAVIAGPVHWTATIIAVHPAAFNAAFVLIQLVLGLGLLLRRTARLTLAASMIWALSIWWLGEGLGGLTTGATLLTGAPGAALLYIVIAALAWPSHDGTSSTHPPRWAISAWSALWVIGAGLQVAAGNDQGTSFTTMFADAGSGAPRWIARLDDHLSELHFSNSFVAGFIAVEIIIGLWALVPGAARRASFIAGAIIALSGWILVQGLGQLTTGRATDPNTGPLLLMLAAACLGVPASRAERDISRPRLLGAPHLV